MAGVARRSTRTLGLFARHRSSIALGFVAALVLAACDGLGPESDRQAKETLKGVWFTVKEEPVEGFDKTLTIHTWRALSGDGTFTEKIRGFHPDGRIVEVGAKGEWSVTGDRFKLRYVAVNGENRKRSDLSTMYAFKIVAVTKDEFSYRDPFDAKSPALTARRVAEIGKEP